MLTTAAMCTGTHRRFWSPLVKSISEIFHSIIKLASWNSPLRRSTLSSWICNFWIIQPKSMSPCTLPAMNGLWSPNRQSGSSGNLKIVERRFRIWHSISCKSWHNCIFNLTGKEMFQIWCSAYWNGFESIRRQLYVQYLVATPVNALFMKYYDNDNKRAFRTTWRGNESLLCILFFLTFIAQIALHQLTNKDLAAQDPKMFLRSGFDSNSYIKSITKLILFEAWSWHGRKWAIDHFRYKDLAPNF